MNGWVVYKDTTQIQKKKCFEKEGTQVDGQFYFHTIIYISQQRYVTYCNNPRGTKMKSSITCHQDLFLLLGLEKTLLRKYDSILSFHSFIWSGKRLK